MTRKQLEAYKGYQLDKDGNRTQNTQTVEATSELEAELILEEFFNNLNKENSRGQRSASKTGTSRKSG